MPAKRPSSDDSDVQLAATATKIQRIGQPNEQAPRLGSVDFSGSVKRKLADSKRTGQACDRCKIRKIRCDGRPEGCTPCEQNRTPCRTTDRISGRATVRGHAEAMESENSYLRAQIADLQAQIKELGAEPRPTPSYNAVQAPWSATSSDNNAWPQRRTSASPLGGFTSTSTTEKTPLPQFKPGSIGDNYLGVAPENSMLSHIKGTSLSIFGTEIDITDFMEDETNYEQSVMSYTTLIKIALGGQHVDPVPLPPYQALREYAVWYLRSLNPYTMLVHKPVLMHLIWRFGNDPNFQPTPPETVIVHMMLATIQYQIATRNSQQSSLMEESHRHYRYALSHYQQLLHGHHKLEDVQALALICHHLRNFPKPGPAWIMTSLTYLFAIELGLHRSVKAWADGAAKLPKLEIEMRKRIFWTLNALQVNLSGRLGRPMPIGNDDIDVEFPEPMNDCLPGEEALDTFHQCSFQVGIVISKYTVFELELYRTIYAVKQSPRAYIENLKRLEDAAKKWKNELPTELRDPATASQDDYIFALFLEYWYHAFMLLLYHPAVCRSADPDLLTDNLDKSLQTSQKMLANCTELMQKKSLDIPWINTVVYIAAVFTTLFGASMRKDQLALSDMTKIRSDMATWIEILGECDHFLGSQGKLKSAISTIVNQSIVNLNDDIIKRTAGASLARVALQTPNHTVSSTSVFDNPSFRSQYSASGPSPGNTSQTVHSQPPYNPISSAPTANPYSLGIPLSSTQHTVFDQHAHATSYTSTSDTDLTPPPPSHNSALVALPTNTTNTPQPQSQHDAYTYPHNPHQQYAANLAFTPHDWRTWTRTYMQPLGPPPANHASGPSPNPGAGGATGEFLSTASSLIALGGGGREGVGVPSSSGEGGAGTQGMVGGVGVHWPEISFGRNGHGG